MSPCVALRKWREACGAMIIIHESSIARDKCFNIVNEFGSTFDFEFDHKHFEQGDCETQKCKRWL